MKNCLNNSGTSISQKFSIDTKIQGKKIKQKTSHLVNPESKPSAYFVSFLVTDNESSAYVRAMGVFARAPDEPFLLPFLLRYTFGARKLLFIAVRARLVYVLHSRAHTHITSIIKDSTLKNRLFVTGKLDTKHNTHTVGQA